MIDHRYLFAVETAMVLDGNPIRGLLPNKDGYYTVPLMVLDAETIAGITYTASSMVKCVTDPSSRFNITITDGKAYGEWDHPLALGKADIPRLLEVYQKNVSHHIRKVWTHPKPLANGGILLMGEIKPCGPYGPYLKENLEDPHMNSSFSVRSLCSEKRHPITGKLVRDVTVLVTFDGVSAGGFKEACKRMSPANESLVVTPADFQVSKVNDVRVAMESHTITDDEFLNLFGTRSIRMVGGSSEVVGTYHPGSNTFIDNDGNKRALLHQLFKR